MRTAYQLHQVRKRHSESFTLSVPQLQVSQGEILCLVGPTGAGKTTLLKLLTGLESPTAGQIDFNETSSSTGPWPLDVRRRISTVSQRPALLMGNVRYNVEFGLRVRHQSHPHKTAATILEKLGLDRLADQDGRTLSGGQIQLVALARALITDPEVLLLDEPTANLDPAYVALVEDVLQNQHRRTNMTIVWATHNLFQARRRGTRTGLLLGGELIAVDETARFFEQPTDERAAAFIQGKMVY